MNNPGSVGSARARYVLVSIPVSTMRFPEVAEQLEQLDTGTIVAVTRQ